MREEGERLYTYRYTVTIRMTLALRWEPFQCLINSEGQSRKTVSTNHLFSEEQGERKRNQAEALLLTSVTPYR